MVDDRPEDTGSLPDSSRPKREPPTIELEATEVSSETKSAAGASSEATPEPVTEPTPEAAKASVEELPVAATPSRPVSPWIVAPVSGAVAAALVIGVGWLLGWPAIQPASAPPAPQVSAAIDGLTARVAGLEPRSASPIPRLPRALRLLKKPSRRCALSSRRRGRKARSWRPPSTK